MMKRLLFFSFIIFWSCRDKNSENILSVQQMQDIQWDLMRADEMVEYYRAVDSLYPTEQKRIEYYNNIYSIHHTNKQIFTRSLNYYTARPVLLKQIIDGVQAKGERQAAGDSVKSAVDTVVIPKDTNRLPLSIDSMKRKKLLKLKR